MEYGTKTPQDACDRIAQASHGSLAGDPSEEYLLALRDHLRNWLQRVELRYTEVMRERVRYQTRLLRDARKADDQRPPAPALTRQRSRGWWMWRNGPES